MVYPKKCVVIDIGNEQIKLADITRGTHSVKINQFVIVPTPEKCLNDGIIRDKERLSNVIKTALKENKIKNKNVVFTISSSKIITREVDFPGLKSKKIKNVILNNATEYFPVNLNDYVLDYVITDTVFVDGEKILKLNLIAALITLVEEYIGLAGLLGVKLLGIDYTGNSLTSFLKKEKIEGSTMVLDIGSENTMVTILVEGISKFNRNLSFGTGILLDCIKNHFEVDTSEAIRISKERPLLSIQKDDNPYLSNDVSSAMNQILNGVSRLADYYTSRNSDKISHIQIVGGGSTIFGIEAYIETFFNLPTKKIAQFKSIQYKGPKNFSGSEIFFANVIGAAYSEINLLPRALAEKAAIQARKRTAFLLVILVAVLLLGYYLMEQGNLIMMQAQKETLQGDIVDAQPFQNIKIELDELTKEAIFKQRILDTSMSTSERFVEIIETMEDRMPSEVFYLNIVDTGLSLEIDCVARDKMTIARFIETLKSMGFSDVYVPTISEVSSETDDNVYVTFSVTCTY